jgi:hypothetical protein
VGAGGGAGPLIFYFYAELGNDNRESER